MSTLKHNSNRAYTRHLRSFLTRPCRLYAVLVYLVCLCVLSPQTLAKCTFPYHRNVDARLSETLHEYTRRRSRILNLVLSVHATAFLTNSFTLPDDLYTRSRTGTENVGLVPGCAHGKVQDAEGECKPPAPNDEDEIIAKDAAKLTKFTHRVQDPTSHNRQLAYPTTTLNFHFGKGKGPASPPDVGGGTPECNTTVPGNLAQVRSAHTNVSTTHSTRLRGHQNTSDPLLSFPGPSNRGTDASRKLKFSLPARPPSHVIDLTRQEIAGFSSKWPKLQDQTTHTQCTPWGVATASSLRIRPCQKESVRKHAATDFRVGSTDHKHLIFEDAGRKLKIWGVPLPKRKLKCWGSSLSQKKLSGHCASLHHT